MMKNLSVPPGLGRLAGVGAFAGLAVALAGCPEPSSFDGDPTFEVKAHSLLPEAPSPFDDSATPWHLGAGAITGEGPEQPIAFPHYRHVTEIGMQCEYCHSSARKSIHGGVPETKVCAGCHWQVKGQTDRAKTEIAKITSFGEGCGYAGSGTLNEKCDPIPWKKVHDAPDFVHFNHSRHVQGGVQCTECHGQVGLQGRPEKMLEKNEQGELVEVEKIPEGRVMVRETTMQMGWCLDCHAQHPSIDKNYGDQANLRRAELKDCWTCHK
jgi:hypothetical protein